MAEETKSQGAADKKKTKKAAPPEEEFDVNKYIIGEETLSFKALAVDTELRKGQVRAVDVGHRDKLMKTFLANPPSILSLTTIWDQGV